jgi:hypothetical protein
LVNAAIRIGRPLIIERLIDAGHSIEYNPISTAARLGHTSIIELLIARGVANYNCIFMAAAGEGGHRHIMDLVCRGVTNDSILAASQLAADSGHTSIVEWLSTLADLNFDVIMACAAVNGHSDVVSLAMSRGATNHIKYAETCVIRGHTDTGIVILDAIMLLTPPVDYYKFVKLLTMKYGNLVVRSKLRDAKRVLSSNNADR